MNAARNSWPGSQQGNRHMMTAGMGLEKLTKSAENREEMGFPWSFIGLFTYFDTRGGFVVLKECRISQIWNW